MVCCRCLRHRWDIVGVEVVDTEEIVSEFGGAPVFMTASHPFLFCFSTRLDYTHIIALMFTSDEKYIWTHHAQMKLRYYRLTESRIKRVIRHPSRIEESIVEGAVACMQPASAIAVASAFANALADKSAGKPAYGKNYSEIWVMYVLINARRKEKKIKQMKIITAWRYPGRSPERDPVPAEILREIRNLIHNS